MKNRIELDSFFQNDVVNLKEHPNREIREIVEKRKDYILDYRHLQEPLKSELKSFAKYAMSKKISARSKSSDYLTPFFHLLDFYKKESKYLSLKFFSEELEEAYSSFLQEEGVATVHPTNGKSVHLKIIERAHIFVNTFYYCDNYFDRDIWNLDELEIDKSRIVESKNRKTISFTEIPNKENGNYAKEYLKYMIINTDKALSTIYTTYRDIKKFLKFLDEKCLSKIERVDVVKFIESLNKKDIKNNSYNACIFNNSRFIEYLIVKKYLLVNHFYANDIKNADREHTFKFVTEYVINQIFTVLDKIPFQEACMFLLLYSTGMRISELCAIKTNSLFMNENGYFIRFYSQKMRKDVINPIPKSLYELLCEQREKINKLHGKHNIYLFPNEKSKCYQSEKYRLKMQEFFKELGIKNTDGTQYAFRPHDYRHTLATTLIMNDIPISVVQKILHHDSIEMSVSYIDINDQRKIKKHKQFINIKGEKMPLHIDSSLSLDDIAKVEWLKKSINAQMLPNGMCSLPVVMGKCPHANSCLTCEEFRTSKEFLPVHEKHYQSVCNFLKYAKEQGWQRQVETNEEVKANLEIIIKKLKEDKEEKF